MDMNRIRLAGVVGSAAAVALLLGCAHGNGSSASSGKSEVRVVRNAQDVAGCEKVGIVRLAGTWTAGSGLEELERLARTKGGNTLLVGGSNEGTAYRCSGSPAAGAP
jgi:hypothetical protein